MENLHNHTIYTSPVGLITPVALCDWALEQGWKKVPVTDSYTLGAFPLLREECNKRGLIPIIGCELLCKGLYNEGLFPLTCWAKKAESTTSLMKLLSLDKVDLTDIPKEGLLWGSSGNLGELGQMALRRELEEEHLQEYSRLTGDFVVELYGDTVTCDPLYEKALSSDVMTAFTMDAYFLHHDRGIFGRICSMNKVEGLAGYRGLHPYSEIHAKWGTTYPLAFLGAELALDKLQGSKEQPKSYLMPQLPQNNLRDKAYAGLKERMEGNIPPHYSDQLEYELGVIKEKNFEDYFLIVEELVGWAKSQGILVGAGRGSAAGSLLAWSLGITDLDPIKGGLYFDRFLNKERSAIPDIDIDFEDTRREDVINHLKERYGEDNVMGICAYSFLHWKSALRDACRAVGLGGGLGDVGGKFVSLKGKVLDSPQFQEASLKEQVNMLITPEYAPLRPQLESAIELASRMRGLLRHRSRHASGVVVCSDQITNHAPTRTVKGVKVVDYDMSAVDSAKLVKLDILGLSTLSLLRSTLDEIKALTGKELSLTQLYELDKETFALLRSGDTTGVFQLSSRGMKRLVKQVAPTCLDDLSILLALYRPGPLSSGMVDHLDSDPPLPPKILEDVRDILSSSRGIILYQEQVMAIAVKIAGYSLGEADLLRRAMGKKKPEEMAKNKDRFIQGGLTKGYSKEDLERTFDLLAHFSGYGFNKAHSLAYAHLALATAHLKTHYRPAFEASYLQSQADKQTKEDFKEVFWDITYPVLPPKGISPHNWVCRATALTDSPNFKDNRHWQLSAGLNWLPQFKELPSWLEPLSSCKTLSELLFVAVRENVPATKLATLIYSGALDEVLSAPEGVGNPFFTPVSVNGKSLRASWAVMPQADPLIVAHLVSGNIPARLAKENRDPLTAVLKVAITTLARKKELKKPWSDEQVLGACLQVAEGIKSSFSPLPPAKEKQALYILEKGLWGEGLTVGARDLLKELSPLPHLGELKDGRLVDTKGDYIAYVGGNWFDPTRGTWKSILKGVDGRSYWVDSGEELPPGWHSFSYQKRAEDLNDKMMVYQESEIDGRKR